MKTFSERNLTRLGVIGTAVLAVFFIVMFTVNGIAFVDGTKHYEAEFAEAAGLQPGDEVQVAGVKVGKVDNVELNGSRVRVGLDVEESARLGTQSTAAIKVLTVLGKKFVELVPRGQGSLEDGATIPLVRTRSPYDVTQALSDLTGTVEDLDVKTITGAIDATSSVLEELPPNLRTSLKGMSRLSQTIASRDKALGELLDHAEGVSGVLAARNKQISTLLADGSTLLTALNERKQTIRELIINIRLVTQELSGLVADNQETLGPALTQLKSVLDTLNKNYQNISEAITRLGPFARQLGEAVSTGPFFEAYVQNLVPTNMAPQLGETLNLPQRGGR